MIHKETHHSACKDVKSRSCRVAWRLSVTLMRFQLAIKSSALDTTNPSTTHCLSARSLLWKKHATVAMHASSAMKSFSCQAQQPGNQTQLKPSENLNWEPQIPSSGSEVALDIESSGVQFDEPWAPFQCSKPVRNMSGLSRYSLLGGPET